MFKDLDNKIILSISYTDQFQYPLTKEEVFLRLIGVVGDTPLNLVEKRLNQMVAQGKVFFKKGLYFLEGSESFADIRLRREEYSQKKWLEVEEFANFVKRIPWIEGIVVTGSQAVDNAKKNDDIDFLIVTKKKRLWLSRVFVVIFSLVKGKKRSWSEGEENSWCLNMWIDSESLQLPERLRNVYGAFEVSQAIWVYDRKNTKKRFFSLNSWAKKFLPNYFNFQLNNGALKNDFNLEKDESRGRGDRSILNSLDYLLFLVQYLYMKPRITREKVSRNFAFFHPRDTKKQIFGKWLRKYKKSLI